MVATLRHDCARRASPAYARECGAHVFTRRGAPAVQTKTRAKFQPFASRLLSGCAHTFACRAHKHDVGRQFFFVTMLCLHVFYQSAKRRRAKKTSIRYRGGVTEAIAAARHGRAAAQQRRALGNHGKREGRQRRRWGSRFPSRCWSYQPRPVCIGWPVEVGAAARGGGRCQPCRPLSVRYPHEGGNAPTRKNALYDRLKKQTLAAGQLLWRGYCDRKTQNSRVLRVHFFFGRLIHVSLTPSASSWNLESRRRRSSQLATSRGQLRPLDPVFPLRVSISSTAAAISAVVTTALQRREAAAARARQASRRAGALRLPNAAAFAYHAAAALKSFAKQWPFS